MLSVYAPRPPAGIVASQGFRLAGAVKRVALAFGDQAVDLGQDIAIKPLPFDILGKGIGLKHDVQSRAIASSSSIVLTMPGSPAFRLRMASSSAALLAGEAVR